MNARTDSHNRDLGGIAIAGRDARDGEARQAFLARLGALGLDAHVERRDEPAALRLKLGPERAHAWTPDCDTTQLGRALGLKAPYHPDDVEREILVAMLAGPVAFEFPSFAELASAIRIRRNIVEAAQRTALAFDTAQAERPSDYWTYVEGRGCLLNPGVPLIAALAKATQPEASGTRYSFSCYRATEYVILLGIAQELAQCNPALLHRLEEQFRRRPIMSGEFHEVFLREYGSMEEPLPPRYYVPGDRLWFRNPDDHSSDVTGYEGSWVFYLGAGLFTNFWKRDQPYTLHSKCLELYHWRHATYRDAAGELQIDESIVEARVRNSGQDAAETERILGLMMRMREPKGVYVAGGCIDTSREYPRCVHPGTSDMELPVQ